MAALTIRPLRVEDEAAFKAALKEFKEEGSGFQFALGYDENEEFAPYVKRHHDWSKGISIWPGYVPSTFLVAVLGNKIVGRISVRHTLNDYLQRVGGHIGYAVVPSYRRKGYATVMLKFAIGLCRELGIMRALVTCDVDNVASARVIEKCGGIFEGITDFTGLEVQKRRYWIPITPRTERKPSEPLKT